LFLVLPPHRRRPTQLLFFFCFGIKSYRFEIHQKIGVFPNGCSCFSTNHSEKRSCE
jgi:hypothetical protein